MYQVFKRNWDKTKYFLLSGLIVVFLLLLAVVYKNDNRIIKKTEDFKSVNEVSELKLLKKFLLKQIKSPFTNINYEIKRGDTIQKILKKYKVENSEIQTVINRYKNIAIQINFLLEIK